LRTHVTGLSNIKGEEKFIPRHHRRSMGKVATFTALSAMDAVKASGLSQEEIASPFCGVAYGSTQGSLGSQMDYVSRMFLS
jgi:3-oxoacyl-(acyl-carrier-protein) synthase